MSLGNEGDRGAVSRYADSCGYYGGMVTTVVPAIDHLPADPSLMALVYQHEHPLRAYEFDDTLGVWTVTARIDADVLAEDLAATSDMDQESLDAVEDVAVGRMSFVRVRDFAALCSTWRQGRPLP